MPTDPRRTPPAPTNPQPWWNYLANYEDPANPVPWQLVRNLAGVGYQSGNQTAYGALNGLPAPYWNIVHSPPNPAPQTYGYTPPAIGNPAPAIGTPADKPRPQTPPGQFGPGDRSPYWQASTYNRGNWNGMVNDINNAWHGNAPSGWYEGTTLLEGSGAAGNLWNPVTNAPAQSAIHVNTGQPESYDSRIGNPSYGFYSGGTNWVWHRAGSGGPPRSVQPASSASPWIRDQIAKHGVARFGYGRDRPGTYGQMMNSHPSRHTDRARGVRRATKGKGKGDKGKGGGQATGTETNWMGAVAQLNV